LEKVIISPLVVDKLESLILVLFEKEYFGFIESAMEYVDNIYDFILTIPSQKKKRAKKSKFGNWYCSYKANKNTTYFISFDYEGDVYLIKNITNNHSRDYPAFINGIK
jgi:hypothetical protein